jgi:hypothetical protein
MLLVDFQVLARDGFSDDERRNIRRLLHIGETIRWFLKECDPPIKAPFSKLVVSLQNTENPALRDRSTKSTLLLNVMMVQVPSSYTLIASEYPKLRKHVFDAIETALREISAQAGWRDARLEEWVRSHRVGTTFHHRIERLSRRDARRRIQFDVYLDVTEVDTTVRARVTYEDGRPASEQVLAHRDVPELLEYFFPARAVRVRDGYFELLDNKKQTVVRVASS